MNSNNTGNNSAEDRRPTEAKASTRTTEFLAYLAAVVAMFVTALIAGHGDGGVCHSRRPRRPSTDYAPGHG